MHTENHFFSSLEKLAEEPINGVVFVSTDKRDLPFLVKLIKSLNEKGELWAKTKLPDLVNSEGAKLLFIIKLITYGETSGEYGVFYSEKEVNKILSDAEAVINRRRPLSEKVSAKIKERKSPKGQRAPMA